MLKKCDGGFSDCTSDVQGWAGKQLCSVCFETRRDTGQCQPVLLGRQLERFAVGKVHAFRSDEQLDAAIARLAKLWGAGSPEKRRLSLVVRRAIQEADEREMVREISRLPSPRKRK